MKFAETREYLAAIYIAGLRQTTHLSGPPGIGKTACARAVRDSLASHYNNPDFGFLAWPATVLDPLDLGGIPAVLEGPAGPFAQRLAFADLIPATGAGILLIDDLPTAPPLTQASLYRLVYERQIGGAILGADWMLITTGNRAVDRAAVQAMPTPLVSKICQLDFEPDLDAWQTEMAVRGLSAVVRAFLAHRPDLFVTFNPSVPGPFATARTWTSAAELCDCFAPRLPPFDALRGWISEGPAIEFSAFASMAAELVSPDRILLEPDSAPIPDDPGALYAVSTALAGIASHANFDRLLVYLLRLPAEFQIFTVKQALNIQTGRLSRLALGERRRRLEETAGFRDFAIANREFLQ